MATGALHHPVIRLQVEHWQNICSLMNTFKMLITVTLQNIEIPSNSPWSSSCYRCIGWHIFFVNLFYLKRLVVISWNRNHYSTSAFLVNLCKDTFSEPWVDSKYWYGHQRSNDTWFPSSLQWSLFEFDNGLTLSESDDLKIVGHQQQDIKWNIGCIHFQSRCVQLSTFYPHVGTITIYGEERVLSILTSGQLPYTYAICAQRYTHAIYGPDFASEYKSVYTLTTGLPACLRSPLDSLIWTLSASQAGQWSPWCRHRQSNKRPLSASQSAVRSALGRGLWCLASMKHTASTTFDSNVPNSKKKKHIGQTNIKNSENRSVASENSREMRLHADQIRWALTPPDIIIFFFGQFFSAQQYGLKSDKSL